MSRRPTLQAPASARARQVTDVNSADAGADNGYRDYYRNSDTGIECTHAIRAALGRDGYIAWLRGTQMKYLWRADAKDQDHPAEYAVKVGWYAGELARVLSDPEA